MIQNSPARMAGTGARPVAAPSGTGRLPRVTQVLALAIHFQDMISRGEARDYADLARLGCLTRERMSQIMELLFIVGSYTMLSWVLRAVRMPSEGI